MDHLFLDIIFLAHIYVYDDAIYLFIYMLTKKRKKAGKRGKKEEKKDEKKTRCL